MGWRVTSAKSVPEMTWKRRKINFPPNLVCALHKRHVRSFYWGICDEHKYLEWAGGVEEGVGGWIWRLPGNKGRRSGNVANKILIFCMFVLLDLRSPISFCPFDLFSMYIILELRGDNGREMTWQTYRSTTRRLDTRYYLYSIARPRGKLGKLKIK